MRVMRRDAAQGMSAVTRNVRDFARMEVAVVNPWDEPLFHSLS